MENSEDPLAQFGLDAIDLRCTLKDIAAKRSWIINEAHVSKLIELGLVEMRDGDAAQAGKLGRDCGEHRQGLKPQA
jgi:hypothetical protein